MPVTQNYVTVEPPRSEIDASRGSMLLEFGSPWCGYCRRAAPLIEQALENHPHVAHIKIADASGRRLGRSFRVKLWPTLVFLKDGQEISRLVRPAHANEISAALADIGKV